MVFVDDAAVFAAELADASNSVRQILEHHVTDMDALVAAVGRGVRDAPQAPHSR